MANSDDPDEMLLLAAFHQDLHCLLRQKQSSETSLIEILDGQLFKIQNRLFHTYCINMFGITHQNRLSSADSSVII